MADVGFGGILLEVAAMGCGTSHVPPWGPTMGMYVHKDYRAPGGADRLLCL